jgi:fumarylpyruvate hydrolase
MTEFVLPAPVQAALPIDGSSSLFPVRRVYCVGRNYEAHAQEMGGDEREPPFFFMKPADALVPPEGVVAYPSQTHDLQHEVELVVALGSGGANIPIGEALGKVWGYAAGIDLTRRDLQAEAKAKGQPWEASKAFDGSAPISTLRPLSLCGHPMGLIQLSVNGVVKQEASLTDMIWSVAGVIAQASRLWRLEPGDLIFTGTPAGVGPLVRGDEVMGLVEGVGEVTFTVN